MNSEKSYYILLAIILFVILHYFTKVKEGFATTKRLYYRKHTGKSNPVIYLNLEVGKKTYLGSRSGVCGVYYFQVPSGYKLDVSFAYVSTSKNNWNRSHQYNPKILTKSGYLYRYGDLRTDARFCSGIRNIVVYWVKLSQSGSTSSNESARMTIRFAPGGKTPYKSQTYLIGSRGTLNINWTSSRDRWRGITNNDMNDNIKYIYLSRGYKATLYEHGNYKGATRAIYGTSSLKSTPLKSVSSIKIVRYNAPRTTTRRTTTPRKTTSSNCSSESSSLRRYRNAYNSTKASNDKLQKALNDKKKQQEDCQAHINNSVKNLASVQDEALAAANKQLYASNDALTYATYAQKGTKQALDAQKEAVQIINKDSEKSLADLKAAQEQAASSNKSFKEQQDKYFKMINLGRLLKKAESFTDLPPPPKAEYFASKEGNWRQKWGEILKDVNITKNRLDPIDGPLHGQNNIRIPLVLNRDLQENMNRTAAQSIAYDIIKASDNMMSGAKEMMARK